MPRIAHDAMQDVLSKSAEARKIALSLKHVEYGGELVEQLMAASSKWRHYMVRLTIFKCEKLMMTLSMGSWSLAAKPKPTGLTKPRSGFDETPSHFKHLFNL